jgi:hypothetical protein
MTRPAASRPRHRSKNHLRRTSYTGPDTTLSKEPTNHTPQEITKRGNTGTKSTCEITFFNCSKIVCRCSPMLSLLSVDMVPLSRNSVLLFSLRLIIAHLVLLIPGSRPYCYPQLINIYIILYDITHNPIKKLCYQSLHRSTCQYHRLHTQFLNSWRWARDTWNI